MRSLLFMGLFLLANFAQAQILPAYGDSRTATTGRQFLKIAPDGRSAAMSESFLAVVDDVSSLYWNPAGLTQLDTNKFNFCRRSHRFCGRNQPKILPELPIESTIIPS
ncbi:MAG: hypothetical protein IPL12_21030 [Bacteroidetes bacterium]|nr:hypothetical protein [Bacteroidota bacterium]